MVQAVHAYRSVADLPEDVELAVIAVPAAKVIDVARECGERGVRALVVISAGFAEAGPEGIDRERELVEVCRAAGMRLVGPNCLGILNTAPEPPPQRDLRAEHPAPRRRRLRQPERGSRARPDRPRPETAGSGSPPSPRSATAPTSPPTTSSSTGRATTRPGWPCSTSSRSATRAASPGWRGGSAARCRSWS